MRTSLATSAVILGALVFPSTAHAHTGGAIAYAFGVALFAFVMGIAAATRNVTTDWRRTGIFFVFAGLCTLISWVALLLAWEHNRTFTSLLLDTFLFTILVVPIPFLVSFTLLSVIGYFTDSDERRNSDA